MGYQRIVLLYFHACILYFSVLLCMYFIYWVLFVHTHTYIVHVFYALGIISCIMHNLLIINDWYWLLRDNHDTGLTLYQYPGLPSFVNDYCPNCPDHIHQVNKPTAIVCWGEAFRLTLFLLVSLKLPLCWC